MPSARLQDAGELRVVVCEQCGALIADKLATLHQTAMHNTTHPENKAE
jgi:hypothetical protein